MQVAHSWGVKTFCLTLFLCGYLSASPPATFQRFQHLQCHCGKAMDLLGPKTNCADTTHACLNFPRCSKRGWFQPWFTRPYPANLTSRGGSAPSHRWSSNAPNMAAWPRWLVRMKNKKCQYTLFTLQSCNCPRWKPDLKKIYSATPHQLLPSEIGAHGPLLCRHFITAPGLVQILETKSKSAHNHPKTLEKTWDLVVPLYYIIFKPRDKYMYIYIYYILYVFLRKRPQACLSGTAWWTR